MRGSRCRPALSVGRRRDLAFGSLAPPSHRKGRRVQGSEIGSRAKTRGVTDRKRAPQRGTQREIVTAGRGWWFLLAPTTRHGAEELRVEKRHQMMEGVSVCYSVGFLHGRPVDADSADATRFTRAPTGASPQPNAACESKARRRQRRQRLVRIESPWVKSPWQIGRTHRSEASVVKRRLLGPARNG